MNQRAATDKVPLNLMLLETLCTVAQYYWRTVKNCSERGWETVDWTEENVFFKRVLLLGSKKRKKHLSTECF